ncbi:MAG: GGDEF domain-containing protein [Thermodesulfobacteriota bacterium]
MSDKKQKISQETILVGSPLIACNPVCAAMKEKGLPYHSVWLQIAHFMKNIEHVTCLSTEQKEMVRDAFDEYLKLVKGKNETEVERFGRDFLAEVDKLKRSGAARALKEEQDFITELLAAISKNISQLASIISGTDTCGMIETLKGDTLKVIREIRNRQEILLAVKKGFDDLHDKVKKAQEKMEISMESLLVLESNALIDKLTGIFNRRFFDQELPKVVQTFLDKNGKVPFSLLLIDIDNFKEINDNHGHFIGDRALQKVAAIIQNNCRAGIDSPIRLGGDEFALFLIGTNRKNALKKAETLRQEISKRPLFFTLRETDGPPREIAFTLRVSIGVCELDIAWKDVPAGVLNSRAVFCDQEENNPLYKLTCMLSESADQALYEAKQGGRDRVCVFTGQKSGDPS